MKHIRWGGLKEVVGRVSIRCWPLGRGHGGRLRSWKSHSCRCRTDACFLDFKIKISNLWFLIETSCCKIQMNLQCTEILMNTTNIVSWFANIPVLKIPTPDTWRNHKMMSPWTQMSESLLPSSPITHSWRSHIAQFQYATKGLNVWQKTWEKEL